MAAVVSGGVATAAARAAAGVAAACMAITAASSSSTEIVGGGDEPAGQTRAGRHDAATDLCFASAAEQQACMAEGQVSSRDLALAYMERIKAIDGGGPRLCSILEVNPEALATAEAMDEERAVTGPRGPLHGVCVLLKDNIDTGDSMHTTAGSLALLDSVPGGGDATIVSKLRHAGAVILGKANLSEWANYRGNSSSGWSARGGQCKNPHVLDNTPSGSSSGSGAAVAAALTAVAVGSETDGSIVSPADVCGVCGVKPTVGLLSRAGIVPISAEQDTPGPMCRSLADCAALLTVLAGPDPAADADPPHAPPITGGGGPPLDYAAEMASKGTNGGLKGARIGVLRSKFGAEMRRQKVGCDGWSVGQKTCALLPSPERSAELLEGSCLQPLRRAGATLVDVELWDQGELEAAFPGGMHELHESYQLTLGYQFARDIGRYLRTRVAHPALDPATACLPRTLADLVLFNVTHRDEELQVFGQERWEEAIRTHQQRSQAEYEAAHARLVEVCGPEGIDKVLTEHQLDALLSPTAESSFPASVAGYPIVSVPAGTVRGLPFGLAFIGTAFSEVKLLQLAYGYEQATRAIVRPQYRHSLDVTPTAKAKI